MAEPLIYPLPRQPAAAAGPSAEPLIYPIKPAASPPPQDDPWEVAKGAVAKFIPQTIQGLSEASERGQAMGMPPGIGTLAGMAQPIVAPLLGQQAIPTPGTEELSKPVGEAMSKAGINPSDYFKEPQTLGGQAEEAAIQGGLGMLMPFGEGSEATTAAKLFPKLAKMAGDATKNFTVGAVGGGSGRLAAEYAPEPLKPLAAAAASIVAPVLGHTALGVGKKVVNYAKPALARDVTGLSPTQAAKTGTGRLAAKYFGQNMSDADKAASITALEQRPHELVPGSEPTAFDVTGSTQLGSMQGTFSRADPEFRERLLKQREARNQALVTSIEGMRSGEPSSYADFVRQRFGELEDRANDLYSQHENIAKSAQEGLGSATAEETGQQARAAISGNLKNLSTEARTLWSSIDPENKLSLVTGPLQRAAAGIYGAMGPEEALTLSPREHDIAKLIDGYGHTLPFQRFQDLRSLISQGMREAKSFAQPNDRAYARLSQLRSAVEDAVSDTITGKIAQEQAAVASGQMQPQDTVAARLQREADAFNRTQGQTGAGGGTGNVVNRSAATGTVPPANGAAGPQAGGLGRAPGNQGLPEDDEFGQGAVSGQGTQPVGTAGVRQVPGQPAQPAGNARGNLGREPDGSLAGLPRKPGPGITASAHPEGQAVAQRYMRKAGLDYVPPNTYAKVDPARAKRIADAYDAMKHDPQNPEVKAAYEAMAKETLSQYQAMLENGMKIEFIPRGAPDPYRGNPRNMTEDVRNNKHMWVFSTKDGFGSDAKFDPSDNPLLGDSGYKISGQPATINDIFRAVHDYFGHVKEGVGFRADGEENAWRSHSAMYSPQARRAMTSETRGQNSWVNYGPHGETNRTARSEDTHYADQKIGLLPDWAIHEGAGDQTVANTTAERFAGAGRPEPEAKALGALTDAAYSSIGKHYGISPEELAQKAPLPQVFRGEQPGGGGQKLFQSQYNNEFHPATAFMDKFDAGDFGQSARMGEVNDLLKKAWIAADRNANDIPLMIDNDHALYQEAKRIIQQAIHPDEAEIDRNGGVGQTFMDVVKAYAPKEDEWSTKYGSAKAGLPAVQGQTPTAPPFYSVAQKVIDGAKAPKMPGDQWLKTIKNSIAPVIKQEELDWLGIEPWLKSQKGSITKEDVANYIRDNSLEVQDVTLRNDNGGRFKRERFQEEDYPGGDDNEEPQIRQGDFEADDPDPDYIEERAQEQVQDENYREENLPDAIDKAMDDILHGRDDNFDPATISAVKALYEAPTEPHVPVMHPDIFGGESPIIPPKPQVSAHIQELKDAIDKQAEENLLQKAREDEEAAYHEGEPGGTRDVTVHHPNGGRTRYTYYHNGGGDGGYITGDTIDDSLEFGHRDDPDDVLMEHLREQWDNEEHGDPEARQNWEGEQTRLRDEHEARQDELEQQFNEQAARQPREAIKSHGAPKFSSYAAPGGQNYTELLLKLPEDLNGTRELHNTQFTGNHWSQPNVVAHVRFDTRDIGGKRTLFVQEIQSDWHQAAQEKGPRDAAGNRAPAPGYMTPELAQSHAAARERYRVAGDAYNEAWRKFQTERIAGSGSTLYRDFKDNLRHDASEAKYELDRLERTAREYERVPPASAFERDELAGLPTKLSEARAKSEAASKRLSDEREAETAFSNSPVAQELEAARTESERSDPYRVMPNAPFKTTWPELALKRMIRWGAEHGYDQVAWTPGDLKNGSLITRPVKSITYEPLGDGSYNVYRTDHSGRPSDHLGTGTPDQLKSRLGPLGPKVADQIASGAGEAKEHGRKEIVLPPNTRVGGDLQHFYGTMLRSKANALVKKFGVEVGRTPMKLLGEDIQALTIPINDKLREAALGGQPLYQGKRGSIQFGPNGESLIHMLEHADASTGVHELGHHFLQMFRGMAEQGTAPMALKEDWSAVKRWWNQNAVAVAKDSEHSGVSEGDVHKYVNEGSAGSADKDQAINRGLHEQWARAFEKYVAEGKAPTPRLAKVFDQFKTWLSTIYKSLTGLNVNLSPEMRGVFDRLLGGERPQGNFDAAARQRYQAATAATKNIKETFAPKPVKEILKRPVATGPYNLSNEGVASALWRPGAEGATTIKNTLKAAGDAPEAREAIQQSAVQSLRRSALKDGVIDPTKLEAWRNKHADALQQMPELDRRLTTAGRASRAMADMAAKRKEVLTAVQKSAVGKLLNLHDSADIATTVGSMLGKDGSVKTMRDLMAEAKGDPVATAGLQSAVVDHMLSKLKTSHDVFGPAQFQKFLGKNAPAMAEVLTPEQMSGLRAVAQELKRSTKEVRSPGGGSDTAENFFNSIHYLGKPTILTRIIQMIGNTAIGTAIGHMVHPIAGIASAIGTLGVQVMRERGIRNVNELVKEAILNPDLMHALLMKAPKKVNTGSHASFAAKMAKLATFTAMQNGG